MHAELSSCYEAEKGITIIKVDQVEHLNLLIGLNLLDGNLVSK